MELGLCNVGHNSRMFVSTVQHPYLDVSSRKRVCAPLTLLQVDLPCFKVQVYVIINNLALFSTLCSNLQTRALWALVSNNPVSENPPFRPVVLSLLVVVSGIFAFSHFLVSQRSLGGLEIQCLFPFAPSFVHCWVLNMSRDHFFHLPWLSH